MTMGKEISHRHTVTEYLQKTRYLCAFSLCPDIEDRKAYENLPEDLRQKLIKRGEGAADEPWSQILLSDYLEFSKNGNRSRFEELYFSRRRKLNALIMAQLAEGGDRFLEDILDGIYLILQEFSWCLPAHNTHVRNSKQQEFPDTEHPIIDLFAAETGALLAVAEYVLRPLFDKRDPAISRMINTELKERIFTPYTTEHFWWMGDGLQPMCNWTPWCTQNILLCAFTRPELYMDGETLKEYLKCAALSLDFFLDEYGDDGACNEGAQYYSHAGLCLFGALYIMNDVLEGGGFEEIFKEPLIRNIANYIVKMNVSDNIYINFADCAALCPRRSAREFLFGMLCGDEILASFAAEDFRRGEEDDRLITGEINLFYHILQALNYKEMKEFPKSDVLCPDVFFESTGLMVARDESFVLAAKAGNNGDSHNHNDVGSFTLYKNGKPLIIDLGVGTYTRETFSERRYEIWTMRSDYHNVPTFGKEEPILQKPGKEFGASGVRCFLGKKEDGNEISSLQMDIAGAYNDERIESYTREVSLIKGKEIWVRDRYKGDAECKLTLMTYEKPEICEEPLGGSCRVKIGELSKIDLTGIYKVEIEPCPIEDVRLCISWKHEVYRIRVYMGDSKEVSIRIS
ncbi:MAG: heparinase [Butyrivibrio sp.]|nr:heparinase [Butyrivibrio sp.]